MIELAVVVFVLFMLYIVSILLLLRKLDRLEKRSIELSIKNAFLRIKLKEDKPDVSDI
jgi:hypothetical protein